MSPRHIQLNYFAGQGVAEPIRLLLADAGVDWIENALPIPIGPALKEWQTAKTNVERYPMGVAPTLEYDGVLIPESEAIFKFLSAELGYTPAKNLDRAYAEAAFSILNDINASYRKSKTDSLTLRKWFEEGSVEKLSKFEAWVDKISGGKGFIIGTEEATFADIKFYELFNWYTSIYSKVLDPYPRLQQIYRVLEARENLKQYIAVRRFPHRGFDHTEKIL